MIRGGVDTDLSCHVPIFIYCYTVWSQSRNVADRRTDGRRARSISATWYAIGQRVSLKLFQYAVCMFQLAVDRVVCSMPHNNSHLFIVDAKKNVHITYLIFSEVLNWVRSAKRPSSPWLRPFGRPTLFWLLVHGHGELGHFTASWV